MPTLERPAGLGDDEWTAVNEAENRLLQAKAAGDGPLVVGSAKELCESIAKVVIAERGGFPESQSDLPELITTAHRLLEFQPGEGLARDPETRRMAQALKSIVLGLGDMRNRHGTGHGRAAPSGITYEHQQLAFEGAFLWSGWALRRLEPYVAGDVTALVRDLEAKTFYSGDLARRLVYADLPRLPVEDQRRLGMAVARRASRGTFVVSRDGLEAVQPDEDATWPPSYVEGLLVGLFFDANGYLDLAVWKVRESARLVAGLRDPSPMLRDVADKAASAISSGAVVSPDEDLQEIIKEIRIVALPAGELGEVWHGIARALEAREAAGLD